MLNNKGSFLRNQQGTKSPGKPGRKEMGEKWEKRGGGEGGKLLASQELGKVKGVKS